MFGDLLAFVVKKGELSVPDGGNGREKTRITKHNLTEVFQDPEKLQDIWKQSMRRTRQSGKGDLLEMCR